MRFSNKKTYPDLKILGTSMDIGVLREASQAVMPCETSFHKRGIISLRSDDHL